MLAEKIKELRRQAGLSQQNIADEMGVSRTAVYKWEMGQSEPDVDTLRRLAERFGVTLDELCGREAATSEADAHVRANIALMSRVFRQLTPDEQEKYLAVGRALFAYAFEQEK